MNRAAPAVAPRPTRSHAARAGMSLLEVLVALGILAAGLASVAALMPAAGARLADATASDRAGALAANAHADLRIRGALTATMFSGSTPQAFVSTDIFAPLASGSAFAAGANLSPTISLAQDELSGGTGVPQTSGVCYGVTVIPAVSATATISPGTPVRVSVVTFKKSDVQAQQISLTNQSASGSGLFVLGTNAAADALRKQFVSSCSWVLAFNATGTARPAWLQVGSSWTTTDANKQPNGSYVSFSDPATATSFLSSGTLTVYGFTRILRVDERPAILR